MTVSRSFIGCGAQAFTFDAGEAQRTGVILDMDPDMGDALPYLWLFDLARQGAVHIEAVTAVLRTIDQAHSFRKMVHPLNLALSEEVFEQRPLHPRVRLAPISARKGTCDLFYGADG